MKKLFFCLCLLSGLYCLGQDIKARQVSIETRYVQVDKHFLSEVGLDFGFPTGDWKDQYGVGIGTNYTMNMIASKNVTIVGEVNYDYIFGKEVSSVVYGGPSQKYDPIHRIELMAGPKLVTGKSDISLSLEAGGALSFFNGTSEGGFCWRAALGKVINLHTPPILRMEFGYGSFQYLDKARGALELRALIVLVSPKIIKPND